MLNKDKIFFEQEIERIYDELSLRPEHYAQVRQSKAFMQNYYSQKIELNDLAKEAFMSRFHYVRMFQRMYGLTPRTYCGYQKQSCCLPAVRLLRKCVLMWVMKVCLPSHQFLRNARGTRLVSTINYTKAITPFMNPIFWDTSGRG
jgi:hypothetical protein